MPKSYDHSDDERRRKKRRRRREEKADQNHSDGPGDDDDDLRNRKKDRSSRKKDYEDRRRHEESYSSSSSSSSSDGESDDEDDGDDRRRRRKHRKSKDKKNSKKRRKDDKKKMARKKKSKSSKHDKKKRSKKRTRRDDDEYGNKKRSRSNNSSGTDTGGEDDGDEEGAAKIQELARNYELAEALYQLLIEHPTPAMAKDTLPLVLLKLGGGTSLDLSQMPDRSASVGIQRVLKTLQPFGVGEESPQVWKWTVPGGGGRGGDDERFLLRIVRTLLNDIGFTMESIARKDQKERDDTTAMDQKTQSKKKETVDTELGNNENNNDNSFIKDYTVKLLRSFQPEGKDQGESTLPGELGGLCKMLLEGENVALDGLPDVKLRQSLEKLFDQCGLEMQEMDPDSDEDEDDDADDEKPNDNERPMGYGLPETPQLEKEVQAKLLLVMRACETVASSPATTAAVARKGPMPMPANYKAPEESSDEEGPAPVGSAQRKEPPPMSKELIKHQAEMRARQLRGAVTGQEDLMSTDPNTREEWMLDPGKFDFLSSIKAGNPMKSRNFRGKSKAGAGAEEPSRVMDASIKAEMDAIMQAHTNARGPTLVEQHRLKKQQEREAKAGGSKKGQWKWSRDKDLDSGRRVDKDALHQVLGGATEDLKKKFQGGF